MRRASRAIVTGPLELARDVTAAPSESISKQLQAQDSPGPEDTADSAMPAQPVQSTRPRNPPKQAVWSLQTASKVDRCRQKADPAQLKRPFAHTTAKRPPDETSPCPTDSSLLPCPPFSPLKSSRPIRLLRLAVNGQATAGQTPTASAQKRASEHRVKYRRWGSPPASCFIRTRSLSTRPRKASQFEL